MSQPVMSKPGISIVPPMTGPVKCSGIYCQRQDFNPEQWPLFYCFNNGFFLVKTGIYLQYSHKIPWHWLEIFMSKILKDINHGVLHTYVLCTEGSSWAVSCWWYADNALVIVDAKLFALCIVHDIHCGICTRVNLNAQSFNHMWRVNPVECTRLQLVAQGFDWLHKGLIGCTRVQM